MEFKIVMGVTKKNHKLIGLYYQCLYNQNTVTKVKRASKVMKIRLFKWNMRKTES